jgi:predicted NUDIX family phosphoesterase
MEFVFVVERARLFDLSFPHGFVAAAADRKAAADRIARIRQHGFFVERRAAEQNSYWKQIIPYVVVRRGDTLLLLERKKKQGEARLHGKLSVGVGGHINPVDLDCEAAGGGATAAAPTSSGAAPGPNESRDVLLQGLRRELEEELDVRGRLSIRAAGFLNDDATDVGAVHFGLVAVADAREADVAIRETELMEGRFVPRAELLDRHRRERERFETWSSLLLDQLDAVLAADLSLEDAFAAPAR